MSGRRAGGGAADPGTDETEALNRPSMADPDAVHLVVPTSTVHGPTGRASPGRPARSGRGPHARRPVRVLAICADNRTRSVMVAALLQDGFDRTVRPGAVVVRSVGAGPEGRAPSEAAITELAGRGLDVAAHRSRRMTPERLSPADLIVAATQRDVLIAARLAPGVFRRSFTLPELCRVLAADPSPGTRSLTDWVMTLSSGRTERTYAARDDLEEVADPAVGPRRRVAADAARIASMCTTVVGRLGPAVHARSDTVARAPDDAAEQG